VYHHDELLRHICAANGAIGIANWKEWIVCGGGRLLADLSAKSMMKAPIRIPVPAGVKRAQLEHRLCAGQIPARAGDAEAVLNEVPARALDHAGGNG
jgi:hypothetical protein